MINCLTTYGWVGAWSGAWPFLAVAVALKLPVWGPIVTAVIFGIRWLKRQGPHRHMSTPLDILRARYARGEPSRQEFESMRQDLER
jgi:putative membrane protein